MTKQSPCACEEKRVSLRPFFNRVFKFLNKEYLTGVAVGFILHAGISGGLLSTNNGEKSNVLHSQMTSKDFSPTQKAQFLIRALIDCPESDAFASLIQITKKDYMHQMDELLADNMIDVPKAVETMGHVLYGRQVPTDTVKKTLLEGIDNLRFDLAHTETENLAPEEAAQLETKISQLNLLRDLFQSGVDASRPSNLRLSPVAEKILSPQKERE